MNSVQLIGRLTRDPEMRQAGTTTVANFSIAIDRPVKQGEESKADYPRIVVFGKQAENCQKYLAKGRKVAVEGRIQTGSYKNQKGDTVYTTDVVASRVEFLSPANEGQGDRGYTQNTAPQPTYAPPQQQGVPPQAPPQDMGFSQPDSFEAIEEDVPF